MPLSRFVANFTLTHTGDCPGVPSGGLASQAAGTETIYFISSPEAAFCILISTFSVRPS